MRARKATVGRGAKTLRGASAAGRRERQRQGPAGESPEVGGAVAAKTERARRGILDATLSCFAEHGWSGTNMSVIARRARMTRGRIQYYFPTLDDLLEASVSHLIREWRRKYFALVVDAPDTPARFESGIDVLWRLMGDPLHQARQELEASARTNPELGALMQQAAGDDEDASVEAAALAYPDLAARGDAALRRARDFTMVFIEGLALYRFGRNAEARRADMIEMLKSVLIAYWRSLGVETLGDGPPSDQPAQPSAGASVDPQTREHALALIREAAELLSGGPPSGGKAV